MRILLGASGGVDSTYSGSLLLNKGYDVEGAVLVMSEHTDTGAALRSCEELGIKLNIVDARAAFEEHVIRDFLEQYSNGRTPNPCVMCNRYVKIKLLCDYAEANGFDKVATGHYCNININEENGRYAASMAEDKVKDQSYMLWQLTQRELAMLMTPLSYINKEETYTAARAEGFASAGSKESQDICFLPNGDYASFVEARTGKFPEGDFVDKEGNILGKHRGIIHYTIGQRKGLGISFGEPMFVTKIDPVANTVTIEPKGGEWMKGFTCDGLNFQYLDEPTDGEISEKELYVKIRYAAKPALATVRYSNKTAEVIFAEPQRAVTPGQSAVFYVDEMIAFGGFICS